MDLPTSSEDGSNYEKFDQKTMDFDKISEHADLFKGYDTGFYAIGVSQTAVTEDVYRKIELDNAIELAKMLKEGGCKDVHWITGQGTSKTSWYLFGKVKAQVEEAVGQMGFRRVTFYRPAGIIPMELGSVSKGQAAVLGTFKALDVCRWMSVESEVLGKAMVANSLRDSDKAVEILDNGAINKIGKKVPK